MKDQKRAKRKAPVDYGITGFDNIDTLAYVTPQLSTISNVVDEVAKSAVEMLFAMIDAEPKVEQETVSGFYLIATWRERRCSDRRI